MASTADENSPPRSDLVAKTRRQSTLLDSPSRVTRSQVRRLSSAPADPPMSPKPTAASRRRSVRVSESISDVASQDDISSIHDEAETSKPVQRPRRSTRRSFAETDAPAPASQRSTLSSIEEDTKPVTRRTRASLKPVEETDSELILPPTRRTRRSSVSSVTSVSTIASNAQSPQRRTRASRRNLSPVPSPTFSEASAISELPEVSPNVKKTGSPSENLNRSSKSATPNSSNASPAVQSSGKTPNSQSKRFSLQGKSPMLKTSEASFTTPRQLNLNDSGSSNKPRSPHTNEEVEVIDVDESDNSGQKSRRSQGRLSLTRKSSQFVESVLQEPAEEIVTVDLEPQSFKSPRVSDGTGNTDSERPRRNSGRLSLSKFVETPLNDSTNQGKEKMNVSSKDDGSSATDINSDLNKSHDSSRRLSVSKFVEEPLEETSKVTLSVDNQESASENLNKSKSELEKSRRSSIGKIFSETSVKSSPCKETESLCESSPGEPNELEKSVRKSIGRSSLSSVKSPEPDKPQRKSVGRLSLSTKVSSDNSPEEECLGQSEKSGRKSSVKSPELEKSQRNSISRLSLNSNKSLIIDLDREDEDNDETQKPMRKSVESALPLKSPELEKSVRRSVGRSSLSSNNQETEDNVLETSSRKSTGRTSISPVKSPELEKSVRKSVGRSSLGSNNQETHDNVLENSSRKSTGRSSVSPVKSPELEKSGRRSAGRSSLSSNNQETEDSVLENSSRKSTGRSSVSPVKSPELEKSGRKSFGRLSLSCNQSLSNINQDNDDDKELEESSSEFIEKSSVSAVKSPELEKSERKSVGRSFHGSNKSLNNICDENVDDENEESTRKSAVGVCASPIKSPDVEKSRRNSAGRFSLVSNKSSPIKLDDSPHLTPRDVANIRSYFASSTPTSIPQKEKSPVKEISLLENSKMANQSLNRSSGRLSATPSKSSNTPAKSTFSSSQQISDQEYGVDDDHEDDDDNNDDVDDDDDDDVGDANENNDSDENSDIENEDQDSKQDDIENSATSSRRASTGNTHIKKTMELESKGKYRASTGSLPHKSPLKSPVLDCEVEEPLSTSHSNNQSKGSSHGNNSLSFNDKTKSEMSEGLNVSPIKQDQGQLRNLTLTPSSSDHSFNESRSPNKALEKSTVFTEQDLSFGSHTGTNDENEPSLSTSRPSSRLNLSQHNLNSSISSPIKNSEKNSPAKQFSEVLSPQKKSETGKPPKLSIDVVSGKVYKDAAFLLSGGNVSDFEDQEEDDPDQWERFSPMATKSKKELRLEKKLKKKMEKELKKKSKLERMNNVKTTKKHKLCGSDVDESNEIVLTSQQTLEDKVNETTGIIHSEKPSKKRISGHSDFHSSRIGIQNDEERVKKRKSLSESDTSMSSKKICLESVDNDVSIRKGSISEDNVEVLLKDFVDIESVDSIESTPPETITKKSKKKKKNLKTDANDIEMPVVGENIEENSEEVLNMEKGTEAIKPIKKKKKVKDQSNIENESGDQTHEIKKKKKKKVKAEVITEEGSLVLKKKKKVKPTESIAEESVKPVKKKKVKKQGETEAELDSTESLKKKKKKVKEQALVEIKSEDNVKLLKKKKKSKKLDLIPSEVHDLISRENSNGSLDKSDKITKKKKKKQQQNAVLIAENGNGSDSDDAPTAVSFAAGKESALAELTAAAQSIQKQKELKKQKLKMKQERIKEEKLAKMKKLKKKQKLELKQSEDFNEPSTGISVDGSSYKIYFDGDDKPQKSKLPKRLPEDFLESLSEQPPTKLVRRADGTKERVAAASVSKEEQERLERKKARKLARKMERQNMLQSDYVPLEGVLGSTRFGVVPLRNIMLAKKLEKNKLAEEAANFRQQSLFGNRIRRTPITSLISHKEKLKAAGKDKLVQSK